MGTLVLRTQPLIADPDLHDSRVLDPVDLKLDGATLAGDIQSVYEAVARETAGTEPANGTLVLLTPPTCDF